MKKTILKLLGFILILVVLFFIDLWVFRTSYPLAWIFTALLSVVLLIIFPYKDYFNPNKFNLDK